MADSIRVLRLSHSTSIWGMEQTILRWAPLLAQQGVDVTYGAPPGGLFAEELARRGFDHEAIDFPKHGGLRSSESRSFASPISLAREVGVVGLSTLRVARVLRRYDLAHSHSLFGHLEVAMAGKLARRPVLLHIHDLVKPGVGRKLLDRAVALSTRTYAITAAVRDCISPSLHHKVVVQHHGLDIEQFRPASQSEELRLGLGAAEGELLVGMLGRIDRHKGVDLLLEAAAGVSGIRVAIIGSSHLASSGYVDELKAYTNRSDVNAGIYPPRTDIANVMQSLDVLVNASIAEPFGRTILEAMGSGIPVVAVASGGVPEFVEDGKQGILLNERSSSALRSALIRVRDDVQLRSEMGGRGRDHVVKNHDLSDQVAEISATYRELTQR